MQPFPTIFQTLPWSTIEIIVHIVAGLGAILLTYGVFLKIEKRQDITLFIGAFCLLIYSLYIGNNLFAIAMVGLMASSFIEFIEILIGLHKDSGQKNMKT